MLYILVVVVYVSIPYVRYETNTYGSKERDSRPQKVGNCLDKQTWTMFSLDLSSDNILCNYTFPLLLLYTFS